MSPRPRFASTDNLWAKLIDRPGYGWGSRAKQHIKLFEELCISGIDMFAQYQYVGYLYRRIGSAQDNLGCDIGIDLRRICVIGFAM